MRFFMYTLGDESIPMPNSTKTAASVHLSIVRHQRGSTGSRARAGMEP